jgi:3-oxoacyl-[acyl-carrier-protein] synthase II
MGGHTDSLGRPLIAITGLGVVSSLGRGTADNWAALTAGTSGIHTITRFPVDNLRTRIAGTVDFLRSSREGASALSLELGFIAAREAIAQAGFPAGDFGSPLFLAAPPVELEWCDRFALAALGQRAPSVPVKKVMPRRRGDAAETASACSRVRSLRKRRSRDWPK